MNPGTRPRPIPGSALPVSARRRAALGAFLRDRRAKLTPGRVGLAGGGRRRTPGLRREEVAQLAGVSVAWYTWLEQGRDIHPSVDALDAIATALRLGAEDRSHAFALAGRELPAAPPTPLPAAAPPAIQAVLDGISFPADARDRAWNVVAWNDLSNRIFGYADRAPADRNPLLIVFGDPASRTWLARWADEAGHLVSALRRAADEAPEDPALEAVVERLRVYPEFRKLWARHDVHRRVSARKELRHPALGELRFETQSFASAAFDLTLVVYVPDAPTRATLARAAPRTRGRARS